MNSVRKYHIEKNAPPTSIITMLAPDAVLDWKNRIGHERGRDEPGLDDRRTPTSSSAAIPSSVTMVRGEPHG